MLFLQCEGPTFTAIQNNWQNYGFVEKEKEEKGLWTQAFPESNCPSCTFDLISVFP
jgi:hypothetical protein